MEALNFWSPVCLNSNMLPSLRFAIRSLKRSPGFTFLAIAILTLGIGATTAMFSITHTILLKPLGYKNSEQLVTALFRIPSFMTNVSTVPVNAQHYELWRDHSRTLAEVALVGPNSHILTGLGEAEHVEGVRVTANFLHLLGLKPALGRDFAKNENQPGQARVVILSHDLWIKRFSGSPDALGRKVLLDGAPYQVIGVMPEAFPFPSGHQLSELEALPDRIAFWTPLIFSKEELSGPTNSMKFLSIARLKPGVSPQEAEADLTALEKVISQKFPEPVELDPVLRPLQQVMAREVRLPLMVLMSAVGAVLLIACINLMNLMLVRAIAQRREQAIRLAVGARLSDLLKAAFLQSFLLSLTGALLGCLFSEWLLQLIRLKVPMELPRIDELTLSPIALLFAVALAVGSALLFGLWPAWRAAQVDPQEALQSSSRTTSEGRKGQRAGKALVAAEVALSTVLLLVAGLLIRSFVTIRGVNPGVKVENLLAARVNLPPDKYHSDAERASMYGLIEEQAKNLPGVISAGLTSETPVTTEDRNQSATAGDRAAPPLVQWPVANIRAASSSYFVAAGVPIKEGTIFAERDGKTQEIMISENLAKHLWPDGHAVGHSLKIYGENHPFRIVGVVGAVHAASLTEQPRMMVYLPSWQVADPEMTLMVRTKNDPASSMSAIRRTVRRLEPQSVISSVQTMRQVVSNSLAQQRFQLVLLGSFSAAALLLACLGIYGVLSFATNRRKNEIGIRMALGARPEQILRSTLASGLLPVVAGLFIGLCASAALARVVQTLLFQVKAIDPLVYMIAPFLLLAVAALACFVPSLRASRLNPVEALNESNF